MCPLLIDLNPSDVEFPLAAFQLKTITREDVRSLVAMINKSRDVNLTDEELAEVFDLRWPQFESGLKSVLAKPDEAKRVSARRTDNELLTEILALTRGLASQAASQSEPDAERPTEARKSAKTNSEMAERIWQHVLAQTRKRRPLILGWLQPAGWIEWADKTGSLQVSYDVDNETAYKSITTPRNTEFVQGLVNEVAPKAKLEWTYIPF